VAGGSRAASAIRYFDLVLLVVALPVFLAADLPLLGYAVLAGAWLAQLAIEFWVDRKAASELAGGNRRAAMGWVGAATLGRVWLVALAVLLVGLLGVLFTVHFACRFIARAIDSPGEGA
jgi:hypothetical protein